MPIFRTLSFLILLLAPQSFAAFAAQETETRVLPIIHRDVTQTSISLNGLRAIYRMRLRTWEDGTPITVFIMEETASVHRRFCKEILNVFPNQMRRAWNRLVFSGSGQAPITVTSVEEMLERVKSTPGAIGYLEKKDATDAVKILEIE